MAITIQKGTLLNAVTGTGAGAGTSLDKVCKSFTFEKRIAGVFSALVIAYEGSIDGLNWFNLATDSAVTAAPTFAIDKPCLWIRANCTTFTGGTNTTVLFVATED